MIERFNGRMPGYLGVKDRKLSFCHIDDVVAAFLAAMERGGEGERYLLCGENLSFHEVFDLAATLTNTSPPKFTTPMWVLELAGFLCVQWARFGAWSGISHQIPLITTQASIKNRLIFQLDATH
jgi:farnesol dehydrogenase